MRILLIHNYYRSASLGGEDFVFQMERDLLQAAGHEVLTYTRSNDDFRESNVADQLKVVSGMCNSSRSRRDILSLVRNRPPDVAHVHNFFPLISTSAHETCHELGVPVVQTVHNYRLVCTAATHYREGAVCELCVGGNAWAAVRHRCYRSSLLGSVAVSSTISRQWSSGIWARAVTRFIALTRFAADRLRAEGVESERIVIKPNHVIPMNDVALERQHYAVFVGRLAAEKGVMTMLEAWRELPDLPLKIIGDGPLRGVLEQTIREQNLAAEVVGPRSRAETLRMVSGALLQVIPSEWFEGMPMVALEAWAQGTPVVAARIGGLAEMLGEDEFGLGFVPGDPRSLALAVRRLAQDPALRLRFEAAGRGRVSKEFGPDMALSALESIYRGAMARRQSVQVLR